MNCKHQSVTDINKIITFRIKDISYNSRDYYSSDNNSSPIVFISSDNWCGTDYGITLTPQMINNITLIASNALGNLYSGVNQDLSFIICITIDEFDVKYTQIGNPYGEERTNNLNNRLY